MLTCVLIAGMAPSSGVDAVYIAIYNLWQSKPGRRLLKSTSQWNEQES